MGIVQSVWWRQLVTSGARRVKLVGEMKKLSIKNYDVLGIITAKCRQVLKFCAI